MTIINFLVKYVYSIKKILTHTVLSLFALSVYVRMSKHKHLLTFSFIQASRILQLEGGN